MNLHKKLLGAVLAAMFGTACGGAVTQPEQQEELGAASQDIINGTDDQGDPAIVSIYAKVAGQEGGFLCTGTIISPTVVLTAAHCVDPKELGGEATFTVITDWNLRDGVEATSKLEVKSVEWDRQFNKDDLNGGHDIAVVKLAQPTSITPIPWNGKPLAKSLTGSNVRIVGYGLSNGLDQKGDSAGTKRQATVKLKSFDEKFVNLSKICSGDSGGPVLAKIDGKEQVIGVNSFGFIFCVGQSSSTRVDTYSAFVESQLK